MDEAGVYLGGVSNFMQGGSTMGNFNGPVVQQMGPYMAAPTDMGYFPDLVSRTWEVTGYSVSMGPNGEEVFMVTVRPADSSDGFYLNRNFRVSEDEFDNVDLGDLIHVSVTISGRPGVK